MSVFSRRQFLSAATGFALAQKGALKAGNRLLSSSPRISAQDFEQYPEAITPALDLFVRNHFATPATESDTWKIQITGCVGREVSIPIDELRNMRQEAITTVMECAGNGVGAGAVGCVQFQGPKLAQVLSECRPSREARLVRLVGADSGAETGAGLASIPYSRVLPFENALTGLLALQLNRAPLSADHGSPVRFVLPGSYGMNSVKWLRRIEVLEQPVADFFMDQRFRRVSDNSLGEGVGDIRVKSIIVQPRADAAIRGSSTRAGGYAWVGCGQIARVEVSVDTGAWQAAKLLTAPLRDAWVPWARDTGTIGAGVHTIMVRAFSASGESQPATRDPRRQDEYELNHYHQIRFMIRP